METLPTSDIFTIIIWILPGFLSYEIASKIGILNRDRSDLEILIWSLILSVIIWGTFTITTGIDSIKKFTDPHQFLLNVISISIITLISGSILGIVSKIYYKNYRKDNSCKYILEKYFEEYNREDYPTTDNSEFLVSVFTKNNLQFIGIMDYASINEDSDLILDEPKEIILIDSGIQEKKEIGKKILIKGDDISRIVFNIELNNKKKK